MGETYWDEFRRTVDAITAELPVANRDTTQTPQPATHAAELTYRERLVSNAVERARKLHCITDARTMRILVDVAHDVLAVDALLRESLATTKPLGKMK